jgi:hypothetical protein
MDIKRLHKSMLLQLLFHLLNFPSKLLISTTITPLQLNKRLLQILRDLLVMNVIAFYKHRRKIYQICRSFNRVKNIIFIYTLVDSAGKP